LISNNKFLPFLEPTSIRLLIEETLDILKIQAKHAKVDILVEADNISFDTLILDKLRV